MSTKEKYKALISALLNAWGGKATVKSAKSVEINGTAHNPAAVVVKTWTANDGLSWYRKYSDGWIEQGGFYYKGSSVDNALQTVTLPTPFSTRTYVVSTMPLGTGTGFSAVLGCDCYTASYRTTSKFTIHMNGGYFGYEWYATGK